MEGVGLKLTPVVVKHLLGRLSMFVPMAGTSWKLIARPGFIMMTLQKTDIAYSYVIDASLHKPNMYRCSSN